jgi:hypothetical protein
MPQSLKVAKEAKTIDYKLYSGLKTFVIKVLANAILGTYREILRVIIITSEIDISQK